METMTYKEAYALVDTIEELKRQVNYDTQVAIFFGCNPDRIKAIEDAANERAKEIESACM